jgi:cyclopropane-fatty-acyl-phospholipid synthase
MSWNSLYNLVYTNKVPDFLIRQGIRKLLKQRLNDEGIDNAELCQSKKRSLIETLKKSPLAIETDLSKEQHYEVPTAFYELCLGKQKKYSSCLYLDDTDTLDTAETHMLRLYCERAELVDGQDILELGCGWGSLTLFLAARYPNSKITGVSHSKTQREFIMGTAESRGLTNIQIITCDINELELNQDFDRVVSVEMFEHVRNYQNLFAKISTWMRPEAKMFVHIFCHKEIAYPFDVIDDSDWMAKNYFSGGIMPSEDLFLWFQDQLKVVHHWRVNGTHYQKTSEHWLQNLDQNQKYAIELLGKTYGPENAMRKFVEWRLFFMACAELFGYNEGQDWMVSHYLFEKRAL